MSQHDSFYEEAEPDEAIETISEFYARIDQHANDGLEQVRKLKPSDEGVPINAGAGRFKDGAAYTYSELQEEERKEEDRIDYAGLMQPDWKDRSRVNAQGKSIPSGGGGAGTGKAKQIIPGKSKQVDDPGEPQTVAFYVADLTPGEDAFYRKQPSDVPLRVLREQAAKNRERDGMLDKPEPKPALKRFFDRMVYGLSETDYDDLTRYPGSARRALAKYARDCDVSRVELIDNGFRKELRPAASVNAPRIEKNDSAEPATVAWMAA